MEAASETASSAKDGLAEENSAAKPATEDRGDEGEEPQAVAEEDTRLADMLFKAVGDRMDQGAAERELMGHFAAQLWTGSFTAPPPPIPVTNPRCSKKRLHEMLAKVLSVRSVYQTKAHTAGAIKDLDTERSLTEDETKIVHNLYMNDVSAWMSAEVLVEYNDLLEQADMEAEGKGKKAGEDADGKGRWWADGKGRWWQEGHWGRWWPREKGKGKGKDAGGKKGEGKSKGKSARQRAQQLKKQRFNKVLNDYAANKAFFMTLVRHPTLIQVDNLMDLVKELNEAKQSKEYQAMVKASAKKSGEDKELKRKRDESRVNLSRGKADSEAKKQTRLAEKYRSGELQDCFNAAEAKWDRVRQKGLAVLLGPRMGE